ncbi:MAG: precorrin-4 C(11)-methyltransferase [Lachnospiraceae bacterium]|nr:precorrin-4 C(11)-methyltransferase [Lachnospiraceae bacterium]
MVYFVGASSGAVDLITVRGSRLLGEADAIIYAGSLVNPEVIDTYAKPGVLLHDSAKLTLEEVIELIKGYEAKGLTTVRLHSGEPSLYGSVREQMDILDKLKIKYSSCPGVSAAFAAAASLNMEFTLPDVSQTLIITRMEGRTRVREDESIESLASHRASMAIYLSSGMLGELSERLMNGGYSSDTPAAIVYKASWKEEKKYICTVGTLFETGQLHDISKTAVILIGDAVTHKDYARSKLYDPNFETGFRGIK